MSLEVYSELSRNWKSSKLRKESDRFPFFDRFSTQNVFLVDRNFLSTGKLLTHVLYYNQTFISLYFLIKENNVFFEAELNYLINLLNTESQLLTPNTMLVDTCPKWRTSEVTSQCHKTIGFEMALILNIRHFLQTSFHKWTSPE